MNMTTAQRLVTKGYRQCLRRVYLLRLEPDPAPAEKLESATARTGRLADLKARWTRSGQLPQSIFRGLLQQWMQRAQGQPRDAMHVDVGITFEGLEALGVHMQLQDIFRQLAPAYAQGAWARAAEFLGDTGSSAPSGWLERYGAHPAHVLVFVHAPRARAQQDFLEFEGAVTRALGCAPQPDANLLEATWIETSTLLSDDGRLVHFGMVDGISSPRFRGLHAATDTADGDLHATGELLLGYARNDGSNMWQLAGARSQLQGRTRAQPVPALARYGQFFRDGSFGAFRKIRQDVDGFERWLQTQAEAVQGAWSLDATVLWLKAKMLGRWPNGTALDPSVGAPGTAPEATMPAQDLSNQFGFRCDPAGLGCPVGSHIRRMNPRDDKVVPFLARPLVRRGTPYGGPQDPDRGLLGLFFCASLEEQFEHVLGRWANDSPMGRPQGPTHKDPLIGNHTAIGSRYEIPTPSRPVVLEPMPGFLQTLGTCYAFFPGREALRAIAHDDTGSYTRFLESYRGPQA